MSSTPLISVLIPIYNYARYLGEAIASVLAQTAIDSFEIIVVDDGSTDNPDEVLARWNDRRIVLVRHEQNQGICASVQHALGLARGTYICQLDADDRYYPDFFESTVPILEQYPDVGLVYGDVAAIDEGGNLLEDPWGSPSAWQIHDRRDHKGNEFLLLMTRNVVTASARLMRAASLKPALPFPGRLHPRFGSVDWYINLYLARDADVYYRAKTLADYRFHASNFHTHIASLGIYEDSVIGVLDSYYAAPPPVLCPPGIAAWRLKRSLYGHAYLLLGDRYFARNDYGNARRCYLVALKHAPWRTARKGGLHRVAATGIGSARYARIKRLWSRLRSRHKEDVIASR